MVQQPTENYKTNPNETHKNMKLNDRRQEHNELRRSDAIARKPLRNVHNINKTGPQGTVTLDTHIKQDIV